MTASSPIGDRSLESQDFIEGLDMCIQGDISLIDPIMDPSLQRQGLEGIEGLAVC
jgi:hypothetical protein